MKPVSNKIQFVSVEKKIHITVIIHGTFGENSIS